MFHHKYTAWNMDTLNSVFDFFVWSYLLAISEPIQKHNISKRRDHSKTWVYISPFLMNLLSTSNSDCLFLCIIIISIELFLLTSDSNVTMHRLFTHKTAYFISGLFYIFTGTRFALMQVKTGLCYILSRFELAPCKETPMHITFNTKSFLLILGGQIPLSFKRAQQ